MKLLVVQLSFVFVIQVCGQGYNGRKPKEVMPMPKMQKDNFGLMGLQGGRVREDPAWIKQLLGSTVDGLPKIGGQGGFARHGGAGVGDNFANGLRDGWGASLSTSSHESVSSWTDPLQGRQFPADFTGGGLVLDPSTGHYIHKVAKSTGAVGGMIGSSSGHQIAKESHSMAKADIGQGVMNQAEHMAIKTIGGVGSIGIGGGTHQMMKQETHMDRTGMSGMGSIGIGGGTHQMIKQETHMDRKGMGGVGSIGIGGGTQQMMKQETHMGRKSMGGVGSIGIGRGTHQIMKQETHMDRTGMSGMGSIGIGGGTHQIMKQKTHMDRNGMGGVGSIGIGGGTHQTIKQETHIGRKNMGGGGIFGIGGGVQHNMVKQSGHGGVVPHNVIKQTEQIGGVNTFGHMAAKSGVGMGRNPISHNIRKSGGRSGVIEAYISPADHIMTQTSMTHESVKFQNGMGQMNNVGANLNSGLHISANIDPFGVAAPAGKFEHNTIKATHGSGIAGGPHQIMKQVNHMDSKIMSGVGSMGNGGGMHQMTKQKNHIGRKNMGRGGVFGIGGGTHQMIKQDNPIDRNNLGGIGGGVQHNMMKQSGHGGVVSHTVIKQTQQIGGFTHGSGSDGSVGSMNLGGVVPFRGTNPVHNVNKVVHSGFASMNHDPLASSIGSQMAQRTIHQSVKTVDMGSNGGVSMGDPFASAAAAGLARESVHVAGKTLGMASSGGGMIGGGHFGGGMRPTLPKRPRMPKTGGYGGRQRKPVVKAW